MAPLAKKHTRARVDGGLHDYGAMREGRCVVHDAEIEVRERGIGKSSVDLVTGGMDCCLLPITASPHRHLSQKLEFAIP